MDYFQVDNSLCMVEMKPLEKWIGKDLKELNIRKNYNVNVVAVKDSGNWIVIDPDRKMRKSDELLIVCEKNELHRINRI